MHIVVPVVARQRLVALFLFVIFLAGTVAPTASVVAAEQEQSEQPVMRQDYPGAMQPTTASAPAAADAAPSDRGLSAHF